MHVFADRTGGFADRALAGLVAAGGIALALLALYLAGFGVFEEVILRSASVCAAGVLVILAAPMGPGRAGAARMVGWAFDLAVIAAFLGSIWWYFGVYEELETGLYFLTVADVWVGLVGVAALLAATHRLFGWPLVIVSVLALVYALMGEALPGFLRHSGFSLDETVRVVWYSFDGVFGRPVAIVLSVILVYVLFGALLEGVGAGAVLLKLAFWVTRRYRGGPAHAAVVASGLFGTMSGSVAANVVGTGVFTIPMIKQRGFQPRFAGAVEAAASTGGQIMPPVMGAVAFIMADVTGVPYLTICVAALIPALFFYGSLFVAIASETDRLGLRLPDGADAAPEPLSARDWLLSSAFFVPLVVIVGSLILGRSAAYAGFLGVWTALGLGLAFNPILWREPARLVRALARAGTGAATVLVAVGVIGIVIGVINMTGLGLRFASLILALTDGGLFPALVVTALACLALGMGMPTVPAYLIIVLVIGPAIEGLGVPTLAVHLFVLYFGVLSAITPPVALGAIVAAPIADAKPMATAVTAVRIAAIGFVIPFMLIYEPSLLLVVDGFDPLALAWAVPRLALAIVMLTTALGGQARGAPLGPAARLIRLGAGIAVISGPVWVEAAGLLACLALLAGPRFLATDKPAIGRSE